MWEEGVEVKMTKKKEGETYSAVLPNFWRNSEMSPMRGWAEKASNQPETDTWQCLLGGSQMSDLIGLEIAHAQNIQKMFIVNLLIF